MMLRILAVMVLLLLTGISSAMAAPCGGVPYSFVNGTVALAPQVNANFAALQNCITADTAASGANSDITSLSGLSTPLSIAQGGTGTSTTQVVDVSMFGVSTALADNGPKMQAAFNWVALQTGVVYLTMGPGVYNFASTFNCGGAGNWVLVGAGYGTEWLRTADYGDTMQCSGVNNITVSHIYALQNIGANPAVSFINPTTNSAHFHWTNVNHFVFNHVAAWNMNYDFEIISSLDGQWYAPYTQGYWDGTNNQTTAQYWFDGTDGVGLGHPKTMAIHDPIMDGYYSIGSKNFTSGTVSNTVANYVSPLGAYDNILVTSIEGLTIDGVGSADKAFNADLHIEPRGAAGKPILQIHSAGMWWDGGQTATIEIENNGVGSCGVNSGVIGVSITGGLINGEGATNYGVYVPNLNSCPAVYGLNITGVETLATVATGYDILAAKGVNITGGSVRGYNLYGTYYNNAASSSGIFIGGISSDVLVSSVGVGGGTSFDGPASAVGAAVTALNGTGWTNSSSGTETWAGPGCPTPPVLNVAVSSGGVLSVTSIANAGSCLLWPYYGSTAWTPSGIGAGSGAAFALSPGLNTSTTLTVADQASYGVSIGAGLTNVIRRNIVNNGYYSDFPTQQLSCTAGTGSPTYSIGLDNQHGKITTAAGSGAVTAVSCTFYGNLLPTANVSCHAFDGLSSAAAPVLASVTSATYQGFNITTAASIGGGGSVSFICDGMN